MELVVVLKWRNYYTIKGDRFVKRMGNSCWKLFLNLWSCLSLSQLRFFKEPRRKQWNSITFQYWRFPIYLCGGKRRNKFLAFFRHGRKNHIGTLLNFPCFFSVLVMPSVSHLNSFYTAQKLFLLFQSESNFIPYEKSKTRDLFAKSVISREIYFFKFIVKNKL